MPGPQFFTPRSVRPSRPKRRFTLAEANKTLPLVKRIVGDIVRTHGQALKCQQQLEKLAAGRDPKNAKDQQQQLQSALEAPPKGMDVEASKERVPEVYVFVALVALIFFYDQQDYLRGQTFAKEAVLYLNTVNRRSMDSLAAKVYYYYALFYEANGQEAVIRSTLLSVHRTATLRRDEETLAVVIHLLLRNYLHHNLYEQAHRLASKSAFPESVGNNQLARYMYYMGRIQAIQLNYSDAHQFLSQALRKVPQNATTAGFIQEATKLSIIVQLLMGDIPLRSTFNTAALREALQPYLDLTQAVRQGDLLAFQQVASTFNQAFQKDRNFTLILRLRHNVIKTGIRMLSLSYTRISLRDICLQLKLDSEEDAEYIIAKLIRDGVIDANLNHNQGFMQTKENADLYSTQEPQLAFDQRIHFCLALHDESVKALRFPMKPHEKELASAEAARAREKELEKKWADSEHLDDFEDMDEF